MTTEKIYDVIIIGAGPAGMTAAVYTSPWELVDTDARAWCSGWTDGEHGGN